MPAGRPLKFQSVDELQNKIDNYFAACELEKKHVTITGLALALGTYRQTLCNYEVQPEYVDTVKTAKLRVENYAENRLYEGAPTGPIFALKNFGWSDRVEQDTTIKADMQHNHTGKIDMGADLIASAIERVAGK
jgi:hypothetical protein